MKRTLGGKSGLSQHPHKKDRIDEGAQEGLGEKNALKRPVETGKSDLSDQSGGVKTCHLSHEFLQKDPVMESTLMKGESRHNSQLCMMKVCKRKACLKIQCQVPATLPLRMALVSSSWHEHSILLSIIIIFHPLPVEDNRSSMWQFGPSYRSDMIIVAARGISLVSYCHPSCVIFVYEKSDECICISCCSLRRDPTASRS
ncbi:hypothetical protein L208DRAFT_199339 [Tricholoma matsutake]|nr:hypothetical protein L208DRAFT_199339 [Tricholoma matsutake 945]